MTELSCCVFSAIVIQQDSRGSNSIRRWIEMNRDAAGLGYYMESSVQAAEIQKFQKL